jgi:hypothetical protein
MWANQSTNVVSTIDWIRVSKDLGISLYETQERAGKASTSQSTSASLPGSGAIRMSLLSFEQDWNAPGMELYDKL